MSESVYLRVDKGALVPADSYAAGQLRTRQFKVGDVLKGKLTKLRNPKFNRLVHKIGQLVVANIESFHGAETHKAIKRLQIEANAGCEEIAVLLPGFGMAIHRTPKSLSFENMDEMEYHQVAKGICEYIADTYWPDMSAAQIEIMAECFVEEG